MPRKRPVENKNCPKCQARKPLSEFYASSKYDGGYSSYCKTCYVVLNKGNRVKGRDNALARKTYARNPEKYRIAVREYQNRLKRESPAAFRAKKFFDVKRDGVAPNVTREYLTELFTRVKKCQCCGCDLVVEYEERETRRFRSNYAAPSIDRVNNQKGYTRENIAVICWQCNHRKTNLTLSDLEMFSRYIKKYGEFDD